MRYKDGKKERPCENFFPLFPMLQSGRSGNSSRTLPAIQAVKKVSESIFSNRIQFCIFPPFNKQTLKEAKMNDRHVKRGHYAI
jgi:hypothetical protein